MPSLLGLDPETYTPSALHRSDRTFRESNCYVDLWIELLHALGVDPASAMAFTCAVDFEGDQWTFFKPPPEDLMTLYGIDLHEMQFYRPSSDHITELLQTGRTAILEADSYYMPDRAATSYHREHVKSSVAIEALDGPTERMRYFHGPGYYELSGEDYRGLFRIGRAFSEDVLPPYVELVRFNAGPRLAGEALRHTARELFGRHLARRPRRNPWVAFGERLGRDLPELIAGTDERYHAFAFATVRQCGAAFELTRTFTEWLADPSCPHGAVASDALGREVSGAKALLLKLARRRMFDPETAIRRLAEDWEMAMNALDQLAFGVRYGAA